MKLQALLGVEKVEGVYLKKYTNVGIFASKVQEILNQLTFRYLNRLIHSLLTVALAAGEKIEEHYRTYRPSTAQGEAKRQHLSKINLINFNMGDMLRARYICLEHEFLSTLAALYKI